VIDPHILVAEIEKATRDRIVSILNSAGYDCLEAGSGKSAMDLLRSDARIRLVLSNMILSEDVDGLTLLRYVKQHHSRTKFVAVTYVRDEEVRQEAIRCGVDGYLLKPFESYRLLETVYDALAPSSTLRVGLGAGGAGLLAYSPISLSLLSSKTLPCSEWFPQLARL